jgi:hypothetical protein
MSAEYYRRRSQLVRARLLLATLLPAAIALLVALSLVESGVVQWLTTAPFTPLSLALFTLGMAVFLFLYSLGLARVTLQIVYHTEHSGIARAVVTCAFIAAYIFVFLKLPSPQIILSLAMSKLFSVFLFFRFWQSQLSFSRLSSRYPIEARSFLLEWRAFFKCRWVVMASFLLCSLGFAMALASLHPVIQLGAWESTMLLGTFFLLFRIFAQNPNAHFDSKS